MQMLGHKLLLITALSELMDRVGNWETMAGCGGARLTPNAQPYGRGPPPAGFHTQHHVPTTPAGQFYRLLLPQTLAKYWDKLTGGREGDPRRCLTVTGR